MKISLENIKKAVFTAGFDREEYEYIKDDLTEINRINLMGLTAVSAGIITESPDGLMYKFLLNF